MTDTYAMTDARANFGTLVRRTAHSHERIAITDHGHVAAILINPQDLADLEDALAVAEYQLRKERGTLEPGIPHDEVGRMLGLR
ncbi:MULTISPECIES: type II toxin-antitoxin system Phd/YefM family antitoxin [unclassified Streptomyces]|uniref:type II toxin-antitoxin system Phd/YefM family antitoxin n=1 Tax=unclassified Streptomyces TaxID=2593676 RepID=UPI00081E1918|nr:MULTISPECIES: type II toxin-antitoxin system Phd/YefM family antitoxin [unclassified Streptomyces]MYZ34382.1 type II toxin-antitoxin system prevent-host-death family antitoxin [Streptomyces sp. SID4917]SCF67001.1 prevent-host-death family protein [Streptomyces sp. MnatMP-M17]